MDRGRPTLGVLRVSDAVSESEIVRVLVLLLEILSDEVIESDRLRATDC